MKGFCFIVVARSSIRRRFRRSVSREDLRGPAVFVNVVVGLILVALVHGSYRLQLCPSGILAHEQDGSCSRLGFCCP
jgi:hypothetical protein